MRLQIVITNEYIVYSKFTAIGALYDKGTGGS